MTSTQILPSSWTDRTRYTFPAPVPHLWKSLRLGNEEYKKFQVYIPSYIFGTNIAPNFPTFAAIYFHVLVILPLAAGPCKGHKEINE